MSTDQSPTSDTATRGKKLSELVGPWGSRRDRCSGGLARSGCGGPRHVDNLRHVDLDFQLNAARRRDVLVDCATGFAANPEEAIRQAIAIWADTTASVGNRRWPEAPRSAWPPISTLASPRASPGWHPLSAAISGVGPWRHGQGEKNAASGVERDAALGRLPRVISPVARDPATSATRCASSSVRVVDFSSCEVVINGVRTETRHGRAIGHGLPRTGTDEHRQGLPAARAAGFGLTGPVRMSRTDERRRHARPVGACSLTSGCGGLSSALMANGGACPSSVVRPAT